MATSKCLQPSRYVLRQCCTLNYLRLKCTHTPTYSAYISAVYTDNQAISHACMCKYIHTYIHIHTDGCSWWRPVTPFLRSALRNPVVHELVIEDVGKDTEEASSGEGADNPVSSPKRLSGGGALPSPTPVAYRHQDTFKLSLDEGMCVCDVSVMVIHIPEWNISYEHMLICGDTYSGLG
jgi:hypothetical protein